MTPIERLEVRARAGEPIILDGANGSELQRLGARMDDGLWCARALEDAPGLVHEVHRRYIDAGADVITTNSFSATREAMQRLGLAARFEDWNRWSARIAREVRDKSPRADAIAVAGSVSSYGHFDGLDDDVLSGHFRAQAEILVGEGADLLILETLGSRARVVKAMVAAAMDFGVPVWVSLSCTRDREETGALRFGIEESREAGAPMREYGAFDEAVRDVTAVGGSALLTMHSAFDVTEDAVRIMRENYPGPVGAYPNAGYWERPNWVFVDRLSPDEYLAGARRWVEAGATIVGGCCGVGVEHIRALAEGLKGA